MYKYANIPLASMSDISQVFMVGDILTLMDASTPFHKLGIREYYQEIHGGAAIEIIVLIGHICESRCK